MFDLKKRHTFAQSMALSVTASASAGLLFIMIVAVGYIFVRSLDQFWPPQLFELQYQELAGEKHVRYVSLVSDKGKYLQLNVNAQNNEVATMQIPKMHIHALNQKQDLALIELYNGNAIYATLSNVYRDSDGEKVSLARPSLDFSKVLLKRAKDYKADINSLLSKVKNLRRDELTSLHEELSEYEARGIVQNSNAYQKAIKVYSQLDHDIKQREAQIASYKVAFSLADQSTSMIPLQEVRRITLPNQMSDFSSFLYFIQSVWEFVSYQPKQNTTHTQVFPALFGTVLMVLLMTVLVLPMGVITAVFLNEYAGDGGFSQLVRAFVYNLASIPSIIYGVFGLVFLVYELGGGLDKLFYANSLPAPTFGTPGLFWASLTMALLTLPVVIIATEEGLKKVPVELRLASHALGATRVETIFRIVIPIASPSIVTGAILAIARGAGEVAPLILVGAVKLAPDLPVSFEFPFIHFEKQFMHLGVLLYDGSFQHSNPYQAETFMFAVCMLLLLLIFGLHLLAARLRGKLYNKYGYGVW